MLIFAKNIELKRFITILLFIVFALRPAYYVGYYAYFQLNIDYIIETYCINTDKPELSCNGKCHLADQLNFTSDDAKDGESKALLTLSDSFTPLFHQTISTTTFKEVKPFKKQASFLYSNTYTFLLEPKLLRPPGC